jgi:hypothetical protein
MNPERKVLPPTEFLRACYLYNHDTGELRWKERPLEHFHGVEATQKYINDTYAGTLVGTADRGHTLRIRVRNKHYPIHRVIYKVVTGEEPPFILDHKDRDYKNNKWENIRPATAQENAFNKINRGYQLRHDGAYRVRVRVDFGTFGTEEAAQECYNKVTEVLHGEFFCRADPEHRLQIIQQFSPNYLDLTK